MPAIEDLGEGYEVLLARLFVDRENKALRRSVGREFENFPPGIRFNVEAIDVAVTEGTSLYIFVASHDENEVASVMGHLTQAADAGDDWEIGPMPKVQPSSDMFLWMLHRWHSMGGMLSPSLKLIEFNTLSTRDDWAHVTRSLRGIDLDRVDTLGAAAEGHKLGPAKLVLHDQQTKLRADLFWLLDGSFDIHRSTTEYDFGPLDKAQLGIFATIDVATKVLPRVRNAYTNDNAWSTGTRLTFIEQCRKDLANRFSTA